MWLCKKIKKLKKVCRRWFWNNEWQPKDAQMWIKQFNNLGENILIDKMSFGNHVAYMDLYVFREISFTKQES